MDGDLQTRRRLLQVLPAICAASALAGCAVEPEAAYRAPAYGLTAYVTADGWHTGIAVPVAPLRGHLRSLAQAFAGARYLWFGWGQRQYYMAKHPTVFDALRALLPSPAVLLVTPLPASPAGAPTGAIVGGKVFAISLTTGGFDLLADYVWNSLALSAGGAPVSVGRGPLPGSVFYASRLTYDAAHTCNTWTAEGLSMAGLPVRPGGVIFASQVVAILKRLARPVLTGRV